MNEKATNLFGGKRRVVWFAMVLVLIAGGLNWYISRPREPMPMYEGKPLSYWLECYAPFNRTETSVQQADHAIQTIGTNAIPTLLRMMQKEDSPLKVRLITLLQKQRFIKIDFHDSAIDRANACFAFHNLGADRRLAVPALLNILTNSRSSACQLPVIYVFAEMGPSADAAVPTLVRMLSDPKVGNRWCIVGALGFIHAKPEITVPALKKCLTDSDPLVRRDATTALWSFGTNAAAQFETNERSAH